MASKRLLDAAALFTAARGVAAQHLCLRKQQWDTLSKSSGLVKGVKGETERVTVTVGAAWELGKRVLGEEDGERTGGWRGDGGGSGEGEFSKKEAESGRAQGAGFGAQVRKDEELSSLRERELQREAESQIPHAGAAAESTPPAAAGEDTSAQRASHVSPELSSLPRVKLPKTHADGQGGDAHVDARGLDQDVYYSAKEHEDGTNTEIFHSPKVARMLGQGGRGERVNPFAGRERVGARPLPEMVEVRRRREAEGPGKDVGGRAEEKNEGIEDLAASIASDAEAQNQAAPASGPGNETAKVEHEMRESRVPSSRFGRLWQYGGLATSMAFGAVGESFRRVAGGGEGGSLMLSEGNVDRLVAKLSRMRGAALKLGQMMSFQDSKVLPPTINTILQRVQDNADYMPASQRDQVLVRNLGEGWRELFTNFEERPFAAASIGQVHKATLASNGKDVAVKIQYPGVRNSIDSDLNNLSLLLTASRLLPKGLYLDKTIANARTELGWECDYDREAQACIRFQSLVADEPSTFAVPAVYTQASGPDVLTAEFMAGRAVTKIKDLTQSERDWIGTQILRLCLRELMEWRFMQTDPNWTNFLYNRQTQKLELLDFGASRDFPNEFVEPYVALLIAASKHDRTTCVSKSIELGYLTGNESQPMLDAHVDSILTLAEPFVANAPEEYDFKGQTITDRVRANIGLMLRERLAPPPEETYSLHRKLSGAFLLCARLESSVRARDMFADAVGIWEGKGRKVGPVE